MSETDAPATESPMDQVARLTRERDDARRALAEQRHERFKADVRAIVTWLHRYANTMNDPHARGLLNTAALTLSTDLRDGRIRRPAQVGAALGRELARLVDEAEPRARQVEPAILPRCASCAFRAGPHVANGSPQTLVDAMACVSDHTIFECHEPARAGQPCSGWRMLQLAHPSAPGACLTPADIEAPVSASPAAAVDIERSAFPKSSAEYALCHARPLDARSAT